MAQRSMGRQSEQALDIEGFFQYAIAFKIMQRI